MQNKTIKEISKLFLLHLTNMLICGYEILYLIAAKGIKLIIKCIKKKPIVTLVVFVSLITIETIVDTAQCRALRNSCNKYKEDAKISKDSIHYYKDFLEKQAYKEPKHDTVYIIKYIKSSVKPIKNDSI